MTNFSVIKNLFNIQKGLGCTKEEIKVAIDKFGNLPKVLIDYYLELGKEEALNNTQDRLLQPGNIEDYGDFIVFYQENQCVCQWCISKADLMLDDPPIYYTEDGEEFSKECESLTLFLNYMAHIQGVFGLEYSVEEFIHIDKDKVDKIKKRFKKKDEGIIISWLGIEFFGDYDDAVLAIFQNNTQYSLIYASSNEEHFNEMDEYIDKYII